MHSYCLFGDIMKGSSCDEAPQGGSILPQNVADIMPDTQRRLEALTYTVCYFADEKDLICKICFWPEQRTEGHSGALWTSSQPSPQRCLTPRYTRTSRTSPPWSCSSSRTSAASNSPNSAARSASCASAAHCYLSLTDAVRHALAIPR